MLKWFRREARAAAKPSPEGRRAFFKAGAGAVVGGAALTTGARAAEVVEPVEPGTGYRKTEHVKRYLDSARM